MQNAELKQERDYAQQKRCESDEEVTSLSEALMIAGAKLEAIQEQLDKALNTDDKREIAALELDLASAADEIRYHKSEIKNLNIAITQEKSSNNSNKDRWQTLSGKDQDLKLTHANDLSKIKISKPTKSPPSDPKVKIPTHHQNPYHRIPTIQETPRHTLQHVRSKR